METEELINNAKGQGLPGTGQDCFLKERLPVEFPNLWVLFQTPDLYCPKPQIENEVSMLKEYMSTVARKES